MKKHISLFEQFIREEGSNIYEAQEMALDSTKLEDRDLEIEKEVYKTWINDYVIPMLGFNYNEKNPELATLISSAKSWLIMESGIESTDVLTKKILKWTNGEIIYGLYSEKIFIDKERNRFPLIASMYDLIKGKPA
jgi:hypothetical protein